MTRRTRKNSQTGMYHVGNSKYSVYIGSRAQVYHGTAYKTRGGLTKKGLLMNRKTGRIVSKKKHTTAKREKRLAKLGYKPVKGAPFKLMRRIR